MSMQHQQDIDALYGATVYDRDGDRIGGVGQVYLDDETGAPAWVTVQTGLFGLKETFVPLEGAQISGEEITVPYEKAFVKDAPNLGSDEHLDGSAQDELFAYYRSGRSTIGGDRDADDRETMLTDRSDHMDAGRTDQGLDGRLDDRNRNTGTPDGGGVAAAAAGTGVASDDLTGDRHHRLDDRHDSDMLDRRDAELRDDRTESPAGTGTESLGHSHQELRDGQGGALASDGTDVNPQAYADSADTAGERPRRIRRYQVTEVETVEGVEAPAGPGIGQPAGTGTRDSFDQRHGEFDADRGQQGAGIDPRTGRPAHGDGTSDDGR